MRALRGLRPVMLRSSRLQSRPALQPPKPERSRPGEGEPHVPLIPDIVSLHHASPHPAGSSKRNTVGFVTSGACPLVLSSGGKRKPLTSAKIAGITTNVSSVDESVPPIIGPAMRCMISDPAPVLHMIGSRPAMIATTVIILG